MKLAMTLTLDGLLRALRALAHDRLEEAEHARRAPEPAERRESEASR